MTTSYLSILNNTNSYKVCKFCSSLNHATNANCTLCSSKSFENSKDEVALSVQEDLLMLKYDGVHTELAENFEIEV